MAEYTLNSINATKPDKIEFKITRNAEQVVGTKITLKVGLKPKQNEANYIDWYNFDETFDGSEAIFLLCLKGLFLYFTGEKYTFYIKFSDSSKTLSKDITIPLQSDIEDQYIIDVRPQQQNQNVYIYNKFSGQSNTCAVNAIASAKEIHELRNKKTLVNHSIGWFFGKVAENESGTNTEYALSQLVADGIPPYEVVTKLNGINKYPDVYSYSDSKKIYDNTGDVSKYSLPQKIKSYKTLNPHNSNYISELCNDIKDSNTSVIITLNIDVSMDSDIVKSNGIVKPITGNIRGGHAMVVLGWTTINNIKYWVCQNSWCDRDRNPYGDDGIYYIPFNWGSYTGDSGIRNFYVLYLDENAPILPEIPKPNKMNPPYALGEDDRKAYSVVLHSETMKGATEYRVNWVEEGTGNIFTTISKNLSNPTFELEVDASSGKKAKPGYTYKVSVESKINGLWLNKSDEAEITFRPITPEIESCYSTSNSNICIKTTPHYDIPNKLSAIVVMRRDIDEDGNEIEIDRMATDSFNKPAIFTNLPYGSKWRFTAKTYISRNGSIIWSYYVARKIDAQVGKPQPFKWDTPKIKGLEFNLTADEWNNLTYKINQIRYYKGLSGYTFEKFYQKEVFKASVYNEARKAIQEIKGAGTYIPIVQSGDSITANILNILVNELNSIVS